MELPPVSGIDDSDLLFVGAERYLREPSPSKELSRLIPTFVSGPAELLSPSFSLGCADYLREPWLLDEFLTRLRRRIGPIVWRCRGRWLQLKEGVLRCRGREVALGSRERRMLRLLILNQGEPVDRRLLESVAGGGRKERLAEGSRALDISISRLRGKLLRILDLDESEAPVIATVYGIGYLLECG